MALHPNQALAARPAASLAALLPGVEQMRRALAFQPRPMPALSDPEGNVNSDVDRKDFKDDPETRLKKAEEDARLVALCERRYRAGRAQMTTQIPRWMEGRACFEGHQWLTWNVEAARFKDMRDPNAQAHARRYTSRNLVKPKVLQNVAHMGQNAPDVGISPLTDRPQDVQAAHEFRALRESFDLDCDRAAQIRDAVLESSISGPPCLKVDFDPAAYDDMPLLDAAGQVTDTFRAQVGKVRWTLVPAGQWMGPGGDFDELPWLVHARPARLSEVQATYENGWAVLPERSVEGDNALDLLVGQTDGTYKRGAGLDESDWVMLKELWEKPTARYKRGRWLVWANTILLVDRPWPYTMTPNGDAEPEPIPWFPFVPLYHLKMKGSLYGMNFVTDLVDTQRSINHRVSKIDEHVALPAFNIILRNGAQVSQGAYRGGASQLIDVIGEVPVVQVKPPLDPVTMESLEMEQGMMDKISMVANVSEGISPGADTSAEAIQSLQQADMTSSEGQRGNLNSWLVRVAQIELALARQFYHQPRLGLYDPDAGQSASGGQGNDGDVPGEGAAPADPGVKDPAARPSARVVTTHALRQGAGVRVAVRAESASARSPQARQAFLTALARQGGFTPDALPGTIVLLRNCDIVGTDNLADDLEKQLARIQQQNQPPNPAEAAAVQAQAQQQLQAQQQAHQQQMQQLDQQHAAHVLALQESVKQTQAAIDLHSKETLAQQKHQFDMMKMQFERDHPAVSLSAAADPAAVVEIEEAAGYKGEEPAEPEAQEATEPGGAAPSKPKRKAKAE